MPLPSQSDVHDVAPSSDVLTVYDKEHIITYLRLLDAETDGADWREVSKIVLHIDPARELERARRVYESNFARAKWMTKIGYRHFLHLDPVTFE